MGSVSRKLKRHLSYYSRSMAQQIRGYDPRVDGASKLMVLVDEINKFEVEETARRKAAAEAGKG